METWKPQVQTRYQASSSYAPNQTFPREASSDITSVEHHHIHTPMQGMHASAELEAEEALRMLAFKEQNEYRVVTKLDPDVWTT